MNLIQKGENQLLEAHTLNGGQRVLAPATPSAATIWYPT